jgi:rhodanese-related sulfurtransferase
MAPAAEELPPARVAELMREGAQVVDVRDASERDAGRIPDDTAHIEMNELAAQAGSLDPARPLVFYCRTGSRSLMAAQAFAEAGFDAHNLSGGLKAWVEQGLPLDPADGRVA